jgi:hypothetical protein
MICLVPLHRIYGDLPVRVLLVFKYSFFHFRITLPRLKFNLLRQIFSTFCIYY